MNLLLDKRMLKTNVPAAIIKHFHVFYPSGRLTKRSKVFPILLWEGRFKSQALLDEKALMACLAYVDLNPVRAKMAKTPESSEHTSIRKRIQFVEEGQQPSSLMPFIGDPREPMPEGLPFRLLDYIELVEWTGRIVRDDKRGHIQAGLSPILERLDIDPNQWLSIATKFESRFSRLAASSRRAMNRAASVLGYKRVPREFAFT